MFCPKCGAQADTGSNYCQKCGAALNQPAGATAPPQNAPVMMNQTAVKTSGMAVGSMVLGIISFFVNPVMICSILAIIFGGTAMGQINRSNGTLRGKGQATAGMVLGIIGIVIMIAVWVWVGFNWTWFQDIAENFH
jgi:hypothetical protein